MRCCLVALAFGLLASPCFAQEQSQANTEAQYAGAAKSGTSVVDTSKWKLYRNAQYGFEVNYPDTWHINVSEGTTGSTDQPTKKTKVTMIDIRKPHGEDELAVYLTVGVQENENPQRLSIDDLFTHEMNKMNSKPQKSGATTIGGQPAIWMENMV
jgi:hypothetical protein